MFEDFDVNTLCGEEARKLAAAALEVGDDAQRTKLMEDALKSSSMERERLEGLAKSSPGPFLLTPGWIEALPVSVEQEKFLAIVWSYQRQNMECYLSLSAFAKRIKVNTKTNMHKKVEDLVRKGYLQRKTRPGMTCLYEVACDVCVAKAEQLGWRPPEKQQGTSSNSE